jgi:integrase
VKLRLVGRNVAENVGDELPRVERHEMTTLTEDQVVRLEVAARGTELDVPILVAIDSGARRGELLALRWSDVDFENQRIVIRRSLEQTQEGGLRFKEPKSGKVRVNALSEDTVAALRRHRAKQNERRLLMGRSYTDNDLVFPRADGAPWNPDYFGKSFGDLVAKTPGIPKVRFHDLRHTSATILLRQGVATKVVSERLGHSTTALTTDTYQHVIAGMDEEAAAKAGQALREARARLSSA